MLFTTQYHNRTLSPVYRKSMTWIDREWNLPLKSRHFEWPKDDSERSAEALDPGTLIESYQFSDIDFGAAPQDAELAAKADFLVAEAKFFATNAAWDAADRAVQIYGGRGWSELYRVGRHLQDVRVCRIYEGTDEIMKLKIASALLGKDFAAFQ